MFVIIHLQSCVALFSCFDQTKTKTMFTFLCLALCKYAVNYIACLRNETHCVSLGNITEKFERDLNALIL